MPPCRVSPHNTAMSAISHLAGLLAGSTRTVVFTGAGISTDSGIPDFRSPGGVWSRMKPIDFRTFVQNDDARREAWRRVFSGTPADFGAPLTVATVEARNQHVRAQQHAFIGWRLACEANIVNRCKPPAGLSAEAVR